MLLETPQLSLFDAPQNDPIVAAIKAASAPQKPVRFTLTEKHLMRAGGRQRAEANLRALQVLSNAQPGEALTAKQQATLAAYSGWGTLADVFSNEPEHTERWADLRASLREVADPMQWREMQATTPNAFYTPVSTIQLAYDVVTQLGFDGGNVFEPSCGVGHFFGAMPATARDKSTLYGCELDTLSGRIARRLYPEAYIAAGSGYQDLELPEQSMDLIIGNPPFGNTPIYDPAHDDLRKLSIHNYFLLKSLRLLRPGGLLAFVISNHYLDARTETARRMAAEIADLVCALRMPNTAHKDEWGNTQTVDLIVYRRRAAGEAPHPAALDCIETELLTIADDKGFRHDLPVNRVFREHRNLLLGNLQLGHREHGRVTLECAPAGDGNWKAAARRAIKDLPSDIYAPHGANSPLASFDRVSAPEGLRIGNLFEVNGEIFSVETNPFANEETDNGEPPLCGAPLLNFPAGEKPLARFGALVKIRDLARELITGEVSNQSDADLAPIRARLNTAYDTFLRTYGHINRIGNVRVFREDLDWPLVSALEYDYDPGVSAAVAKRTGQERRKPSARKAPIFAGRTVTVPKVPESVETVEEALMLSLATRGGVYLPFMSKLTGLAPHPLLETLGDRVFRDPTTGRYVVAEHYLTGDVKTRLEEAREAAENNPAYARNVAALEAVQPADIAPADIRARLGAPWIPVPDVIAFARHILGTRHVGINASPELGVWEVNAHQISEANNESRWGTKRRPALTLLAKILTSSSIQVHDTIKTVYGERRELNIDETNAAQAKADEIQEEFQRWIWSDPDRRRRLSDLYNRRFNRHVAPTFDGSHLTLPGKVPDSVVRLQPHQLNAVWRAVVTGGGLFDHVVGAGKTFAAIASVMERIRLGLAGKVLLTVPNHLVGQWAADIKRLYPAAKVLAPTERDFERRQRRNLFARIATGDWDLVVIAHSSFKKIPVTVETELRFLNDQVSEIRKSINMLRDAEDRDRLTIKQLEGRRARLEARIRQITGDPTRDFFLPFEEMGFSQVVVDEAHEFKNLGYNTAMRNVAGLGNPTGSERALDMFMKVRWLKDRNHEEGVFFLTGTPLSNTIAEMYTLQRYLGYNELLARGCAHFDAWAKVFAEVTTDWELDATGVRYAMKSRFSRFVNLPDLVGLYRQFADTVTKSAINKALEAQDKRPMCPPIAGGKPQNVVVPRSHMQAEYMEHICYRAENYLTAEYQKNYRDNDNMLVITNDARKAALDIRIINRDLPDDDDSKVNTCVRNIVRLMRKWDAQRGTQLVFCDLSTPSAGRDAERKRINALIQNAEDGDEAAAAALEKLSPDEIEAARASGFSVYDDIRAKLVEAGCRVSEVAFIHEAKTDKQKVDLFAKVNSGQVRVLLGSTAKLGCGANVQERLVALHHLDAPWRPSDVEQREGRIDRQGNQLYLADPDNFEIEIYRYATERTYDARMWGIIEAKARFIEQLRSGQIAEREVEDISMEAANAADLKAAASGNPLILEDVELKGEIRRLTSLERNFTRDKHYAEEQVDAERAFIERYPKALEGAVAAAQAMAAQVPEHFAMTVNGEVFDLAPSDEKRAKDAPTPTALFNQTVTQLVYRAFGGASQIERTETIGEYAGFEVVGRAAQNGPLTVFFRVAGGGLFKAGELFLDGKPVGRKLINRLEDGANRLMAYPKHLERRHADAQRRLAEFAELLGGEFPHAQRLADLKARHREVMAELQKQAEEAATDRRGTPTALAA